MKAPSARITKPPARLLPPYAPLDAWWEAERQAGRSTMGRFHTGAVLLDKSGKQVSRGTSHRSSRYSRSDRSIHAEEHACMDLQGEAETCVVVGLSRKGYWIGSPCPCGRCARILRRNGVKVVVYAELTPGGWSVRKRSTEELDSLSAGIDLSSPYAKDMRLASSVLDVVAEVQ